MAQSVAERWRNLAMSLLTPVLGKAGVGCGDGCLKSPRAVSQMVEVERCEPSQIPKRQCNSPGGHQVWPRFSKPAKAGGAEGLGYYLLDLSSVPKGCHGYTN